jgi:toxin YoeB
MIYTIITSKEADKDISELKTSEIATYNKVRLLFDELKDHPRTGTGKPEILKYSNIGNLWSRRITKKHRLVYQIKDSEIIVLVLSAKGHYEDN